MSGMNFVELMKFVEEVDFFYTNNATRVVLLDTSKWGAIQRTLHLLFCFKGYMHYYVKKYLFTLSPIIEVTTIEHDADEVPILYDRMMSVWGMWGNCLQLTLF